jgi:hypothetical protein
MIWLLIMFELHGAGTVKNTEVIAGIGTEITIYVFLAT